MEITTIMTRTVVFFTLFVLACVFAGYTTKYDRIDLDEILSNDRIYKKYLDCLATNTKCTPDGKELREILPDALKTGCSKCNEKQKKGAEKVIKFLWENKRADFDSLQRIFDPTGTYKKNFAEEARKLGINI